MKKQTFLITLLLFVAVVARAEIRVTSALSNNMVLQRNEAVNIWGEALQNAEVEVKFAGQSVKTTANNLGKWTLKLKPLKTNRKGSSMEILENGKVSKTIQNILVGEVWIVAGQSNMGLQTRYTSGFEELKKNCDYPLIRYYAQSTVFLQLSKEEVEIETKTKWLECNSKNIHLFSSVGSRFGIGLFEGLKDVPIGLIFAAKGGSAMTSYIPEDKVHLNSFAKERYEQFLKKNKDYDYAPKKKEFDIALKQWEIDKKKAAEEKTAAPSRPIEPQKVCYSDSHNTPVYLFNTVVAHIAPFSCKGVLWYQGETDSGGKPLENFTELLTILIDSWRERFEKPELNFVIIQLPSITPDKNNNWPVVRWKQYKMTESVNNCYASNNIDQGEQDVHPKEKRVVAKRAADVTLREVYNQKKIKPYGPRLKSVEYNNTGCIVSFNLDNNKLKASDKIEGFELKIANKWIEADAKKVGDKVEVSSEIEGEIEGVRYLWYNWAKPLVSLWADNDTPAMGFCDEKK